MQQEFSSIANPCNAHIGYVKDGKLGVIKNRLNADLVNNYTALIWMNRKKCKS